MVGLVFFASGFFVDTLCDVVGVGFAVTFGLGFETDDTLTLTSSSFCNGFFGFDDATVFGFVYKINRLLLFLQIQLDKNLHLL